MKRAISMLLAIALACSFVFAGGVAAQEADQDQVSDQDIDFDQYSESTLAQEQNVDNTNVGLQGGNVAYADDDGDATSVNSLEQSSTTTQVGESTSWNDGDAGQNADQEAENEVEIDLEDFF